MRNLLLKIIILTYYYRADQVEVILTVSALLHPKGGS